MRSTTIDTNASRSDVGGTAAHETLGMSQRATKRDRGERQRSPKADGLSSQARSRTRVAPGICKDRWGLAATVKVNGVQRELRFPPGTPLKAIRARRDELRASLRMLPRRARQTLASDADRYLDR